MRIWPYSPWWGALPLVVGVLSMFVFHALDVPQPLDIALGMAVGVIYGFTFLLMFGRLAMRRGSGAGEMPRWQAALSSQVDAYQEWNEAPMREGPAGSYRSEASWAAGDQEPEDAVVVEEERDSAWTEDDLRVRQELADHLAQYDDKPPVDLDGGDGE